MVGQSNERSASDLSADLEWRRAEPLHEPKRDKTLADCFGCLMPTIELCSEGRDFQLNVRRQLSALDVNTSSASWNLFSAVGHKERAYSFAQETYSLLQVAPAH